MSTAPIKTAPAFSRKESRPAWRNPSERSWWPQHREVSLNWLALGLLLAAWNASDDGPASQARRRPGALRGYAYVSVRAATHHAEELRITPEK